MWLAALERFRPDILAACRAAVAGSTTDGLFVRLDTEAFAACPSDSIDYAVMEKLDPGQAVVILSTRGGRTWARGRRSGRSVRRTSVAT